MERDNHDASPATPASASEQGLQADGTSPFVFVFTIVMRHNLTLPFSFSFYYRLNMIFYGEDIITGMTLNAELLAEARELSVVAAILGLEERT